MWEILHTTSVLPYWENICHRSARLNRDLEFQAEKRNKI